MQCPPEVAEAVLEILTIGILRIRGHGNCNEADRCANEADHLHNLPALLASYRPELLAFYLDTERPAYLSGGGDAVRYEALWNKLIAFRQAQ